MTRQHWTCIVAAVVGGVATGAMGLAWLESPPPGSTWSMVTVVATGYALLVALAASCVGAVMVLQGRTRLAAITLGAAGVLPGLLEPRAFVTTFMLVFAGLLASSLPRRRVRARG